MLAMQRDASPEFKEVEAAKNIASKRRCLYFHLSGNMKDLPPVAAGNGSVAPETRRLGVIVEDS
jgi:hypothetical protein